MELLESEKMLVEQIVRSMSDDDVETALSNLRYIEALADGQHDFPRARMAERIKAFVENVYTPERL